MAKTLQRTLDRRHEGAVQSLGRVRDAQALAVLWADALVQGEVSGAYSAILSHRSVTPELRLRVFGDVHMLSHQGAATHLADVRRLPALERGNAELRDQLNKLHVRSQAALEERDRTIAALRQDLAEAGTRLAAVREAPGLAASVPDHAVGADAAAARIALQTERRERAEQAAAAASGEAARLAAELAHMGRKARALRDERSAAETQLLDMSKPHDGRPGPLERQLRGQRILYVGGRPSSTPAIRDLVLRHGGEIERHDGGLEDRKSLLPRASPGRYWSCFRSTASTTIRRAS